MQLQKQVYIFLCRGKGLSMMTFLLTVSMRMSFNGTFTDSQATQTNGGLYIYHFGEPNIC